MNNNKIIEYMGCHMLINYMFLPIKFASAFGVTLIAIFHRVWGHFDYGLYADKNESVIERYLGSDTILDNDL